jgi:effector-binding domain-containing protein
MTEPEIQQRPAQPYLGIAGEITDGVPAFVDKVFPELFGWLREHGVEPGGAPFIRYRELDPEGEPLEIEVGVPVDDTAEGDERVRPGALPAGRYLTLMHVGPYRSETAPDLGASRERLIGWADEQGLVYSRETDRGSTLPCCLERYLVGPVEEPDFTKWETEFAYLVLDD